MKITTTLGNVAEILGLEDLPNWKDKDFEQVFIEITKDILLGVVSSGIYIFKKTTDGAYTYNGDIRFVDNPQEVVWKVYTNHTEDTSTNNDSWLDDEGLLLQLKRGRARFHSKL